MTPYQESLVAWSGVFTGSLIWDVLFGDGIQNDDYVEACTVALIAALIQWHLGRLRRQE